MARNIEDIQRDIERTRRQLAGTLDELAQRSKPQNFANEAKTAATDKLQDRNVQMALGGVGAAVANALYNATGVRIREYPITLDKYLDRLPEVA